MPKFKFTKKELIERLQRARDIFAKDFCEFLRIEPWRREMRKDGLYGQLSAMLHVGAISNEQFNRMWDSVTLVVFGPKAITRAEQVLEATEGRR